MTRQEKIFLWLAPLPVVLCGYAYLPVLKWLVPPNVVLAWMPMHVAFLLSGVLLVIGIRWAVRAFWRGIIEAWRQDDWPREWGKVTRP